MRRWLPVGLLAVSLAFNVMFIVGFLEAGPSDRAERRAAREAAMIEAVGLSPDQVRQMRASRRPTDANVTIARIAWLEEQAALMDLLKPAEPDEAAVDDRLERLQALREQRSRLHIERLRSFADTLPQAQREKMFDHLAGRMRRRAARTRH